MATVFQFSLPSTHDGKPGSGEIQPLYPLLSLKYRSIPPAETISSSCNTKMKAILKWGHLVTLDYHFTEKPFFLGDIFPSLLILIHVGTESLKPIIFT